VTTESLGHHTSKRFDEDLERLRGHVLQMGGLVEQQLNQAISSLVHGSPELTALVVEEEREVNQLECVIDEQCSRILATRSPTASDLRLIIGILKTATDLERIGDEGKKIARLGLRLAVAKKPLQRFIELRHLGEGVASMVHDTLDAFARLDPEAALVIAQRDRIIDEEYEAIQRQNMTFMMEDPRAISRALDVMWAVRALERIGDHAKNICEHIIYIVHGKNVSHTRLEDVAQQLPGGQRPTV
jgi:phosphate transport system protein